MGADELKHALESLATGDFELARDRFGELLENRPDDPDMACGFYTASYWLNRSDLIKGTRPGRARGNLLLAEWEDYNEKAQEKGFPGLSSYRAGMKAILGMAAEEFRLAFQEEGKSSVNVDLLDQLARLLIRIEEYEDAIDVLQFSRRVATPGASLHFLLGEAMLCTGQEDFHSQGLSHYRDAFFLNPAEVDPSIIASDVASRVFQELYSKHDEKLDRTLEWMPAEMMIHSLIPGLRPLQNPEMEQILWETGRLEKNLAKGTEKFHYRIRARLAFYYLTMIYHCTFNEKDPDGAKLFEEKLSVLNPELFTRYREIKSKKKT